MFKFLLWTSNITFRMPCTNLKWKLSIMSSGMITVTKTNTLDVMHWFCYFTEKFCRVEPSSNWLCFLLWFATIIFESRFLLKRYLQTRLQGIEKIIQPLQYTRLSNNPAFFVRLKRKSRKGNNRENTVLYFIFHLEDDYNLERLVLIILSLAHPFPIETR